MTSEIPDWSWWHEPTSPLDIEGPARFYAAPVERDLSTYPFGLDDDSISTTLASLPVPRRTELADVRDRWVRVEEDAFPRHFRIIDGEEYEFSRLGARQDAFSQMIQPRAALDEELITTFVALLEGLATVDALKAVVDKAIAGFCLLLASKGEHGGALANHEEPWLPVECCGAPSDAQIASIEKAELARIFGVGRKPSADEADALRAEARMFAEGEAIALRRAGLRSREDEKCAIRGMTAEFWASLRSALPSISTGDAGEKHHKMSVPFAVEMGRPKVSRPIVVSPASADCLSVLLRLDIGPGETMQSVLDWRCTVDLDISRAREAKLEAVDAGVAQTIAACGTIGVTKLRKELKERGIGMREQGVVDSLERLVKNGAVQGIQKGKRRLFACQENSSQIAPKVDV